MRPYIMTGYNFGVGECIYVVCGPQYVIILLAMSWVGVIITLLIGIQFIICNYASDSTTPTLALSPTWTNYIISQYDFANPLAPAC